MGVCWAGAGVGGAMSISVEVRSEGVCRRAPAGVPKGSVLSGVAEEGAGDADASETRDSGVR